ncbi:DUF937 domain-containing protein [Deinococcus radiophilus]|uniref:DUF937 domain-containing protein n=1 Tax=Deinococcus radiophilus TaxID=32062 RepID=A0A431VYZ3_9DEIO|nr:DUF937 domain-containing protein [Deinococcus radiophilus]RTR28363.1 DUF937 domain-containing protein [Deinococcus radiophilus]UFA51230.1 DUF937 domain-containing protein [Deinococcus radiophilus]
MDLLQMLAGQMQAQQVAQRVGTDPAQTQDALQAAVPLLLGALTRNAQQGQAGTIEQAVAQHGSHELEQFAQGGQLPDMADGHKILGHVFGGQQQAAANAVGQRSGINPQLAMQILSIAAPLVLSYLNRQRQAQGGTGLPTGLPGGLPQTGAVSPAGGDITSVLTSVLGGLLGGGMAGGAAGGNLGGALDQVLGGGQSGAAPQGQRGDMGGLLGTLNRALDRDGDGNALNEVMDMLSRRRA